MSDEGKLYVGGLSYDTEEDGLAGAFGKYGAISDCIVLKDRETGRSRGFGFVTYENPEDAKDAEKGLNGTELDGRQIRVNQADRGRGRGGRGRGDRGYGGGGDRSYGGGDRSYGGGDRSYDRSYGGGGERSYGDRSYSGGGRSFSRGGSSEGRSDRNQYQSSGYSRPSYRDSYE